MNTSAASGIAPIPFFENEARGTSDLIEALASEYTVPKLLQRFNNWRLFSLGPAGSGVPAHRHQENWFAQVIGRKAWLLAPPSYSGDASTIQPPCHGFNRSRPEKGVVQCVQMPGEVLWLPARWSHATCNLDALTVGIGGQGDLNDQSLLHIAAKDGDMQELQNLLDVGGLGVNNVNHGQGKAPLHVACERGRLFVAKALLSSSADVRARDKSGHEPLHDAAAGGCTACLKLLLEHGAEISATTTKGSCTGCN